MHRLYHGLATLIILSTLCACSQLFTTEPSSDSPKPSKLNAPFSNTLQNKTPIRLNSEISISAIGDILIHDRVYNDAKTTNGYDFIPMLNRMKPYLNKSTITVANQETMIGGEEIGLSGYPQFNSPQEIGDDLQSLGVDVVTLANNHSLDKGVEGINRAIDHWEEIGMNYTGAFKSKEDSENILVYRTKENISVAFLSYTYGTNGITAPPGKSYVVNRINYKKIDKDIKNAKQQADSVIISLHFGEQYQPFPNSVQKDLAQFAADRGVDAVIGHHPHVLQPIEWVQGKYGNKTLVAYSLGNFFSGQEAFKKRIGGMLTFYLEKSSNQTDPVKVINPEFLITYVTSEGPKRYEVTPMASNPKLYQEYLQTKKHLSQWMDDLHFIE